jgi:hypothetical protein
MPKYLENYIFLLIFAEQFRITTDTALRELLKEPET